MKRLILVVVALCVAMAQIAVAEDLQPPWWRGQLSTTSQVWEFSDSNTNVGTPAIPPDGPAPGGQPPLISTGLLWYPGEEPPWNQWLSEDMGRFGVVPLSGFLDVTVDNHEPPNEFKWVWVQLTWRSQSDGEEPILENFEPLPDPNFLPKIVQKVDLGGGWWESTYDWRIYPNPKWEKFRISGTINVDELVIDTWCIPEPTTMVLLGLGSLFFLRKRKA